MGKSKKYKKLQKQIKYLQAVHTETDDKCIAMQLMKKYGSVKPAQGKGNRHGS